MEFSKQDHWSELSFSPPGDRPNSRIEPGSPTLQANFLLSEPPRKCMCSYRLLDKIRPWFLWPRQIFSPGSPTLLALCPQSPYRICSPPVSLWLPVCPGSDGKESAMQETQVRSLSREDHLEEEMTTHSSILAWRIPWTEEPGGL